MNLYEIPIEIEMLLAKTAETDGEITPEIQKELVRLEGSMDRKVESIGKALKNEMALSAAISAEIDALKKRQQTAKNNIDSWKEYLRIFLVSQNKQDCKTPTVHVWRQASTPSLVISDQDLLPDKFKVAKLTLPVESLPDAFKENAVYEVDKARIKKSMEAGQQRLFCVNPKTGEEQLIAEYVQGEHLRIK